MMRLSELLDGHAQVTRDVDVAGMTLDSREVTPGDVFVALQGGRDHGLAYLDQAVTRGCAAVLWEPAPGYSPQTLERYPQLPGIEVPGLAHRLGNIASRYYGHPSRQMTVVGVTGTNGKSSFVQLLSRALDRRQRAGTLGTLGVGAVGLEAPLRHTTPDAIAVHRHLAAMADAGVTAVAMEVSSHALDQSRVVGVAFDGAVFTNLTRDHLDYHRDMDDYAAAKARLFGWDSLEFVVLNADDDWVGRFRHAARADVLQLEYGLADAAVTARALSFEPDGITFELTVPDGSASVRAGLLGRFNIYNLLAVAATLHALGWACAEIAEALAASEPVSGRMNVISLPGRPRVVIDYAHTPDALGQCLSAVEAHGFRHVICVFGCGGDRDRGKRPLMAQAAEGGADRVVVTDDNPRTEDGDRIVADIMAGFDQPERVTVIRDRSRAIRSAIDSAGADDLVVIAGKGHETYQEIGDQRHPFNDRDVAQRALEGRS